MFDGAAAIAPPGQAAGEIERLHQRLKRRRDPIRLKEYCFQLMWHYRRRAEFERCVEICDEGTALAAQLGSEPVQYSTIKALTLMDLGRFDAAWDALQQEVSDERHPFGRTMKQLGVAVYLEQLGALERAATTGRDVLEQARQLNRTWMQQWMIDLLTALPVRLDNQGCGQVLMRRWPPPPFGHRASQSRSGTSGKEIPARRSNASQKSRATPRQTALDESVSSLWKPRCARWPLDGGGPTRGRGTCRSGGDGVPGDEWRMLGHRARARIEIGNRAGAARDAEAARQLLAALAATVPDPDLRACFEVDPTAQSVLAMTAT